MDFLNSSGSSYNALSSSSSNQGSEVSRQSSVGGGGGLPPTERPSINAELDSWQIKPRYILQKSLGSGAYGKVAQAFDRSNNNKQVAIKFMEKILQGASTGSTDAKRAFREIHILRHLRFSGGSGSASPEAGHPNVITLLDVFTPTYTPPRSPSPPPAASPSSFLPGGGQSSSSPYSPTTYQTVRDINDLYAVFEYMDTDLQKIFKTNQPLGIEHIKFIAYQMMAGLKFIHSARVIHRDLKPANILINCDDCTTKIADFGLSRVLDGTLFIHPNSTQSVFEATELNVLKRTLTSHVVTRWYRAPEIILKQRYTSAVDVWSMGCILAEMFACQPENVGKSFRRPLFPGANCGDLSPNDEDEIGNFESAFNDEAGQLMVIFRIVGTPKRDELSNYDRDTQRNLMSMKAIAPRDLKLLYPNTPDEGLDLLRQMLSFDPSKRIDCDGALKHPFFESCRQDYENLNFNANVVLSNDHELSMESNDRLLRSLKEELDHYP